MSTTYIDMSLEILQKTDDGDRLDPSDLYLLQTAVNGGLSEIGEVAFMDLHSRCSGGEYKKPWFHDIEHMTRCHEGYVYWKGKQVEHYSFRNYKEEGEAVEELAQRCLHLEKIDVKVSCSNAVWNWEKFATTV